MQKPKQMEKVVRVDVFNVFYNSFTEYRNNLKKVILHVVVKNVPREVISIEMFATTYNALRRRYQNISIGKVFRHVTYCEECRLYHLSMNHKCGNKSKMESEPQEQQECQEYEVRQKHEVRQKQETRQEPQKQQESREQKHSEQTQITTVAYDMSSKKVNYPFLYELPKNAEFVTAMKYRTLNGFYVKKNSVVFVFSNLIMVLVQVLHSKHTTEKLFWICKSRMNIKLSKFHFELMYSVTIM